MLDKKFIYILDLIAILCFFLLLMGLQYENVYGLERGPLKLLKEHYKAVILLSFTWLILADYTKLYSSKRIYSFQHILKKVLAQVFFYTLIIFTISGIKDKSLLSNVHIIYFSILVTVYIFSSRSISFFYLRKIYFEGKNLKHILIVGQNVNTSRLINIVERRKHFGLKVVGVLEKLDFEKFLEFINQNKVEEVFISQSGSMGSESLILNYCEDNHIVVNYIPNSLNSDLVSLDIDYIDTLPIFKLKKYPLEKTNNQLIKTLFDVIFSSLVCILILSWLFPIIALLIKIDSRGPIIFKQKRKGLNGKEFDCFKFRTMRNDGTNSIKATVVNDNRITKIGRILRKTSFDELPQFINVLKGDMSIVGPRPHMITQDEYYSEIIKKYNLRNYVKPGITGLAQIKGYRGAIDSDKDMEDRIRADIFYVRNWSILLDVQIIYQTVVLVFKGDENAI